MNHTSTAQVSGSPCLFASMWLLYPICKFITSCFPQRAPSTGKLASSDTCGPRFIKALRMPEKSCWASLRTFERLGQAVHASNLFNPHLSLVFVCSVVFVCSALLEFQIQRGLGAMLTYPAHRPAKRNGPSASVLPVQPPCRNWRAPARRHRKMTFKDKTPPNGRSKAWQKCTHYVPLCVLQGVCQGQAGFEKQMCYEQE